MGGVIRAIIESHCLPDIYSETVSQHWYPLAAHIARLAKSVGRPLLIGISGAQGSGKSTLCLCLEAILSQIHGIAATTISLDDFYLTRAERKARAGDVHPLFAVRGVPGTHDLGLADRTITALLSGTGSVAIPRFDKAHDDRAAAWSTAEAPCDVVLFEGWCIGATPEPESALVMPINALEAADDPVGIWRTYANTVLGTGYAALFARIDRQIILRAPDFAVVSKWRKLQERKLRANVGVTAGLNAAGVDRFLQHFERITLHMLATPPGASDVIYDLTPSHEIGAVQGLDRANFQNSRAPIGTACKNNYLR